MGLQITFENTIHPRSEKTSSAFIPDRMLWNKSHDRQAGPLYALRADAECGQTACNFIENEAVWRLLIVVRVNMGWWVVTKKQLLRSAPRVLPQSAAAKAK